ncbi:hypothetical protein [Heyndrickxia acidicola]|uniref:Uncharacterized protein n=1 Tax=Heyndrickxia acidicola TaxID=209389 RepID=A0ABU6MN28_9BACI|nr:hypothetical protein [Heyndrickxia acidicola]MED1206104.1 hypothetical protein [Heyndrickxia acidicola]
MSGPLLEREVHELMNLLNTDQKNFLESNIKQSKKSKWLEVLALKKGVVLNNKNADEIAQQIGDWVLIDVLDGGYGNRPYKCECGKSLRYQYIVLHQETGKTYGLGETCFEYYTSLPPQILKDIKTGFHNIDLERDEILLKVRNKDFFIIEPLLYIKTLPEQIVRQSQLQLPLTQKQIAQVYHLKDRFDAKLKVKNALKSLTYNQDQLYQKLTSSEQEELINKIITSEGYNVYIPSSFSSQEVLSFKDNNLPLLDRHIKQVQRFRYNQSHKKVSYTPTANTQKPVYQGNRYIPEKTNQQVVNYESIISQHLEKLKQVREKESYIPRGLVKDWVKIQEEIKTLKAGGSIDYSSFKLRLSNLVNALGLY